MNYTLILTPKAENDFDEAFHWYVEQETGLGKNFAQSVDDKIRQIQITPDHYQVINDSNVRRAIINRFPYSIYFISEPHQITVFAILHQHRDPKFWESRK